MSEQFEWVPDVARGEWLRPMEAEPFGSILSIVPRGFQAYARVFHPVDRHRPRNTRTWRSVDVTTYFDDVEGVEASLESERCTWAKVAASFDTTMHAEAQFTRLVRRDYHSAPGAIGADGWRFDNASEGSFDTASLAAASVVLARHTGTPDAGIAAIWEGWGGLVSSAGVAHFGWGPSDEASARYIDEDAAQIAEPSLRERLATAARQGIAGAWSSIEALPGRARSEPEPGSGLLTREAAAGPRFDLHGETGRRYVLFEAGANDFADSSWPKRAPWVDKAWWAQSPSIVWPDDHSWVLATEIDFDSTLVAGTSAFIDELLQTPGLEALPLRTEADLSLDGDLLNRPK